MNSTKQKVVSLAGSCAPNWFQLSDMIFQNPEFNFKEFKASKWISESFKTLGFSINLGVGDIATAFTAELDSNRPGPKVGIIVEYDAIEGLGHACGHNLKGPSVLAGVEAFLQGCPDFGGKIVVFGCPAEEGGGGKVLMAERDVFNSVDICLELGVGPDFATGSKVFARQGMTLTVKGISAHAGLKHLKSINALDALLFVLRNLDYLKKHLGAQGIINAVIKDGGLSPSVIPGKAVGELEVRTLNKPLLNKYTSLIGKLVAVAEESSGAQFQVEYSLVYLDYIKCPSLTHMVMDNFKELGIDAEWLLDKEPRGSSDVGNVSHVVPTETIYIGLGHDLVPHTVEYREASGGEPGRKVIVAGAKVLSACLLDLLVHDSKKLITQAKAEFLENSK